ncbi:hypothetical protein D3C83_207090 [compost metagenome]
MVSDKAAIPPNQIQIRLWSSSTTLAATGLAAATTVAAAAAGVEMPGVNSKATRA